VRKQRFFSFWLLIFPRFSIADDKAWYLETMATTPLALSARKPAREWDRCRFFF